MRVFQSYEELSGAVGQEVGPSDWTTVTQERIDQFADATGDHQWTHVDPERAARESPYGATVAHGYLTLSLIPSFLHQVFDYAPKTAALNYGLERVRFTSPVVVGSRLRGAVTLESVSKINPGTIKVAWTVTIETEGQDRPACIAKVIALLLTDGDERPQRSD